MGQINQYKNIDFFTLEIYKLEFGEHEKSCIYKELSGEEFLNLAYRKAVKLLNF